MTTHKVPGVGEGVTQCCGRTPFELPRTERLTDLAGLVTCRGRTPDADPRPLAATQGDETAVPASTSVRDGSGAQNGAEPEDDEAHIVYAEIVEGD